MEKAKAFNKNAEDLLDSLRDLREGFKTLRDSVSWSSLWKNTRKEREKKARIDFENAERHRKLSLARRLEEEAAEKMKVAMGLLEDANAASLSTSDVLFANPEGYFYFEALMNTQLEVDRLILRCATIRSDAYS